MKFINKFIKPLIIFMISILIIPILLTIFNLFGIESNKILIIIISSITTLITGIILGKNCINKGYLNGILLSIIIIAILLMLSLIFRFTININSIIYYLILIITTVFGSMLGISFKNKK